ncbi:hypothetical protein K3495_g6910 [Podosphaera aphanis]|nr:hypothetical protein K3495_g6910 [Podosphaera aphanis]
MNSTPYESDWRVRLKSARGNTTLESAVSLTKKLRWDIQCLGVKLEKAANAEEKARRSGRTNSHTAHEAEIRNIVQDIKRLLVRIEDAVPLMNLAITTSGASLSTTLPPSVSPSRLLQASTFLTAGDTQYLLSRGAPVQIGPTFTLSLYMLFAGHSHQRNHDEDSARDATWKEVIHKAKVKLMRSPIEFEDENAYMYEEHHKSNSSSSKKHSIKTPHITGDGYQNEYSYHLKIIEDFDDGRIHSLEESETKPGPYEDIELAGLRESFPIFQIGKIFYADTGKILNIESIEETNSPVLLLKRDIDAQPPRKMMKKSDTLHQYYQGTAENIESDDDQSDSQEKIDRQLLRESSIHLSEVYGSPPKEFAWGLPANLDPEWLAFEVYSESNGLDSEDEQESNLQSIHSAQPLSSSSEDLLPTELNEGICHLNISSEASSLLSPSPSPSPLKQVSPLKKNQIPDLSNGPIPSPFGPIRSSLSLLEMLIRLTSLQQFQQASHLSIPDELLTFFLEESSTTGAGGNEDQRKRTRYETRRKVGFDPYDESPIKKRGEEYQRNHGNQGRFYREEIAPNDYDDNDGLPTWPRDNTPDTWLLRDREESPNYRKIASDFAPSSPLTPYRPPRRTFGLERIYNDRPGPIKGSQLGKGASNDMDSSLGTSPGSPST